MPPFGNDKSTTPAALEPRLAVSTTQDRLVLGADVIHLEDASTETYTTDDFADFIRFAAERKDKGVVFYSNVGAYMMGPLFQDPRKNKPLCELKLTTHPRLQELIQINGKELVHEQFEVLLRKLKANLSSDGLNVLDKVLDFKVAKVQKIERKKERNGNFRHIVTRESAGTDDFTPPETLKFTVPLFQGQEVASTFEFDFRFDFKDVGDGVLTKFTLENLNLQEDLLAARKDALGSALSAADLSALWGSVSIDLDDDSWKYKRNALDGQD